MPILTRMPDWKGSGPHVTNVANSITWLIHFNFELEPVCYISLRWWDHQLPLYTDNRLQFWLSAPKTDPNTSIKELNLADYHTKHLNL